MLSVRSFSPLYAKASTGKIKWWEIEARQDTEGPFAPAAEIVTRYGYLGQEAEKIQTARVLVREGKNLGRANETSTFEQACLEAQAKWQKKRDKKYVEDPSGESEILLPMLALEFNKQKHRIQWPCMAQPKLNGIRMLARKLNDTTMEYISRGNKRFESVEHFDHVLLNRLHVGDVLDGEIYIHGMALQDIGSIVKRVKEGHPDRHKLCYYVYDMVISGMPFVERERVYHDRINPFLSDQNWILPVQTIEVPDELSLERLHLYYLEQGYEGTMLRNKQGLYRCDFRSPDLQKYKDFEDAEFRIVGGKEGVGKDTGKITWECVTSEGKIFEARPRGTDEQRREWFQNREQYFGRMLTVRYMGWTNEGKPFHPVGIAMREGRVDAEGNFHPDF